MSFLFLKIWNINIFTFFDLLVGFKSLPKLKKLEILNLGDNRFNKTIIKQLSGLTSLKTLVVSNNHIEGLFPSQGIAYSFNILSNHSTIIYFFNFIFFLEPSYRIIYFWKLDDTGFKRQWIQWLPINPR